MEGYDAMNSDHKTYPLQLPQIVSIVAILILTLLVGVCSAFVIYITDTHFNTQKGWTVCAMSVLSVLAFIGYCWYRVFTEKAVVKPEVTQEQPEGVWPPAPVMTTERNNP